MKQDEIIRMAKEAGFVEDTNCEIYGSYYHLERFAALVRAEYEAPLKLAEKTLEDIIRVYKFETGTPVTTLAAIREALAEPVKQEPVAVISESAIGLVKLHSNGACLPFGTQLYAAPVSAKREWVDLTDYEIVRLYAESPMCDSEMIDFARAAIAAFKEKNE